VSKKKKGPEREIRPDLAASIQNGVAIDGAQIDPELAEGAILGNRAFASRLARTRSPLTLPFDVVRDTALPMIERATLALELRPRPAAVIERYVAILETSHLPDDQRQLLVAKLVSDQAVATGIADILERHFTGDDDDIRHALGASLDHVWDLLQHIDRPTSAASAGEQAEALIGVMAAELTPELGEYTDAVAASVSSFCRALFLAMYWDEDEEEELGGALPDLEA
jgi:hypothetical protein